MMVIWVLGAIIVYRVKRLHITGDYVISFIVLAYAAPLFHRPRVSGRSRAYHGPMYQLFIFFMITDPKTTVKPRWGQCLVAFLIAVVEMGLRLDQSIYAPFYALAIVGPIANVVEILWTSHAKSAAPAQRVPAMA